MARTIIVKNTTGSEIDTTCGLKIEAGGEATIPFSFASRLEDCSDFVSELESGNLVINNSQRDLSYSEALDFITLANDVEINQVLSNTMVNSVEIAFLKGETLFGEISYFVDSFDNSDLIDGESTNFEVNTVSGYVSLIQGGSLSVLDVTKAQFDLGTFSNTESFNDVGGDGALRKEKLSAGAVTVLEDFEDLSNVSGAGSIAISQNSVTANIYEGTYSLDVSVDFSAENLDEEGIITIDLGAGGIDVSGDKFIRYYLLRKTDGALYSTLELEDDSGGTYLFDQRTAEILGSYQDMQELLTDSFSAAGTPTSLQDSGGASGTSTTFDIGTAGNDRLIVIMACDEHSGTANDLTDVTVDGKSCTKVVIAQNDSGAGNHLEMWYILESDLGSSNGSVTVALSGADSGWAFHIHLYYNAAQQAPSGYAINDEQTSSTTITTETQIAVQENYLVVACAGSGASGDMAAPGSPLSRVTDGPDPSSAVFGTSYVIESRNGSYNYTENFSSATNRGTMIAAAWPAVESGIDETALRYVKIHIQEDSTGQTILEVTGDSTPTDDIEHLWNFDGNYLDEVGEADGTPTSNITFDTGIFNQAIDVPGTTGERVSIGNLDLNVGDQLTFSVWIYPRSYNSEWARIISKTDGTAVDDHYWAFLLNNDGDPVLRLRTGTTTTELVGSTPVGLDEWTQLLAWYDGSEMRLYVNNVEDGSTSKTGNVATNSGIAAAIGNNPSGVGDRVFDGLIDQFTIWNKALNEDERDALYTAGLAINAELLNGITAEQTFTSPSSIDCERVKIEAYKQATEPNAPLYVGIANIFGTTLATGRLDVDDASTSAEEHFLTLDNTVTLTEGSQYLLLLRSESSAGKWLVPLVGGTGYTGGVLKVEGVEYAAYDIKFTLYTPAVVQSIYLDKLEVESESTYETTGTFTSRGINLGLVPDDLDTLTWTEVENGDTVQVRVRFAASEVGLSGASWSSYYSDPTGAANDLSGVSPNLWFQYEVSFTGGDSADSNVVKDVTLEYSITPGSGSATIISEQETCIQTPVKFSMVWVDEKGTGTANYYVSRDNKATWQSVPESQKGKFVAFTSDAGTQVNMKAVLTGNARLYGWALATDVEFEE